MMNQILKGVTWLLLLGLVSCSIQSRTILTTHTEFGAFNSFVVQFKPSQDICLGCLLQLQFPQTIHSLTNPLPFTLTNEFEAVIIQSFSLTPTSSTYYFKTDSIINGSVWYKMQIWPTATPSLVSGLVGMAVVSQSTLPNIVYMSNSAFEYYHLQPVSLPPQNIIISPITASNTQPGAAYVYQFTFTSTYTTTQTTTVSFFFTNQNYALLSTSSPLVGNNNFQFTGSCQIICNSSACISQVSCSIVNNQIKLVLPYLSNVAYSVQLYVVNPNFVDSTGLAAQTQDPNGLIKGIGILNNLFSTSPISILPAPAYLHWGIPLDIVTNTMNLGLFVDGGWNTVDLGFTVGGVSAIGSQFTVSMYVGASRVLEQSINTNLPQLNATTSQRCTYSNPYIICTPVDAFTSTTVRYYIRFKAYFKSTDPIATLGSITINFANNPTNALFSPLSQTLAINVIAWADYHDYAGFHNSNLHSIQQTQVLGIADSGLVNSTSTFIDSLSSSSAFVGIDPQIPNQQLIFLLKTDLAQTSNAAASQTYQMKVYFNPNIFDSISDKGIDITAYSVSAGRHLNQAVSCYIDSSLNATTQIYQCQAYNDYIYNTQYDNTLTLNPYFGQYQFVCGNGKKVVCATPTCAESCRIFKGQANTQSSSGVFSLRNVTFKSGYQSPYLANNMVLDFIIAFYQGGQLISASLINAYTIKSSRLQLITNEFHNVYLTPTQTNTGSRVPTLLCLNGMMSVDELTHNFDKLMVFVPNQVSVNSFVQGGGRVGCSKNCSAFKYTAGVSVVSDNWLYKQAVTITSSLNLQTNINFKLPITITNNLIASLQLALFANNSLIRIYRLKGSAVGENFNLPTTAAISANASLSLWSNPDYWVRSAGDQYKQAIDLNQISAYSSQNTIDMLGSVLTYTGSPSSTFTSLQQSIFSSFSTATSNNINSCDLPFTYSYNTLYNATVLWCPLSAFQGNQILINYPYYPNNLGSGFPFSQIFSYGFDDGSGNLVAFRTQSGIKSTSGVCQTISYDVYNYAQVTKQPLSITITLPSSILLSPNTYNSFALLPKLPTAIPVNFLTCEVQQTLLAINFGCTFANITTNQASLILTYTSIEPIAVVSIKATVWLQAAAAASVNPNTTYFYSMEYILPQTDALNLPTFYGLSYTPYSSTIFTCSSTLALSSIIPTAQPIAINDLQIRAISLNYLCQLNWAVQFSHSRRSLLPGQQIVISFVNLQTTVDTFCSLLPENYSFDQMTLASNSVTLVSNRPIDGFSLVAYRIVCKELLLISNAPSLSVRWLDGANTLQQSNSLTLSTNFPIASSISSSITAKAYNTLGYDSQYQLTVLQSTAAGDRIDLWLDLTNTFIHSLALQCYYGTSRNLVYCGQQWSGKVHISLLAAASSNLIITIYGIRQLSASSSPLLLMAINKNTYFVSSVIDSLMVNVVATAPITIESTIFVYVYNATNYSYCAEIGFAFPAAYSSSFFVTVDDSFLLAYTQILNCTLNGLIFPCNRVSPNLVQILSTSALSAAVINTLSICGLTPNSKDMVDSLLNFKIFTTSGQYVGIGSHDHRVMILQLPQIPSYLNHRQQWSYNLNTSWSFHVAYLGYYRKTLQLSTIPPTQYTQPITQNYSSLIHLSYSNSSLITDMGDSQLFWDIAANDYNSTYLVDTLQFSTSSLLYSAPNLAIYVSDQKCQISLEYQSYTIYTSGITIPILLDFSNCRPVSSHYLNFSINSPYLVIDTTLSNSLLNASQFKNYIVIRQIPTFSFTGSFSLQTILNGPFNSSFLSIPTVTIQVSPSTLLQIPQSQLPTINNLNSSFVNVSVQCNQPSTIYWTSALAPAIIGMTAADLQSKLTIAGIGMVTPYRDSFSWAGQIYGFTYAPSSNEIKNVEIKDLQGSSNYNFKYYCVNQLGYASAGQILNFTTPQSLYGLTKVTLTFASKLTISQANQIACQIAQVLLTPYRTVTTSTFSNCYNTSNAIYRTANTSFYDETQSGQYRYFFYIDSKTVTTNQILSQLPTALPIYQPFILNSSPYSSISTMALTNNYQPAILSSNIQSTTNSITLTADVGVANSYLVLAYINTTFDINTMSLPSTYLIKQGNFSTSTQFNQVYMLYGQRNITVNISQLTQYQNYSIFYYATVDNPALNSRSTQVYYQNVQTLTYVAYYLHQPHILVCLLLVCFLLFQ